MKHRHALALLGLTTPICVLLRALQMCFIIDEKTGFAKQSYSVINFGITIIVCAAAVSVGCFAAAIEDTKQEQKKLCPSIAIVSALTSGMFFYQMISGISNQSEKAWYDVLLVALSFACVIVFLAYGLKNIYDYKMPPMILIVPVLYYIVKMISIFVSTSALAMVTENVFLILTNGILLWFMFELAFFENGMGAADKSPKKLFAAGLAAVIMCAITSIPKFIFAAVSDTQLSSGDISAALLNAAVGVFVLAYIVSNFAEKPDIKKNQSKHSA